MRKAACLFGGIALFFIFVSSAEGATCTNGMVETPADVRTLIPALPECVLPSDLQLFQAQGFQAAAEAMKRLGENICPGFQLGYNASIPPAQLKEKYVYFMYPTAEGRTVTMSAQALTCFDKALTAMKAANLNVCISAAFRSPQHQDASCNDRANGIVCGRTNGGGCSGSYGNCPHVSGRAMDFDDKTTCTGRGQNNGCSLSQDFANKMRQAAATAGARATVATDLPHLECTGAGPINIPNGGVVGPPTNNQGGLLGNQQGGIQGLMQGLSNFFAPPPVPQCQAGFILMNGACLPSQAQAANQTTSPYSYITPPPSPITGTGSSSPSGGSTGTGVDIGSSVNISGLINSDGDKKTGTSSSAIDLINAIAGSGDPQATSTTIGTSVALNDSLKNPSTLQGTLASSTATLSPTSTYKLNPTPTQTFVSDDLSKTPTKPFANGPVSTFALLENMRQVLLSILSLMRPFGGVTPTGTIHSGQNTATAILR